MSGSLKKKKDLIGIENMTADDISHLLQMAKSYKEVIHRPVKKVPVLRGKTVGLFFVEDSTRTRTSFELAAKRLSADLLNMSAKMSSLSKGESLVDTAKTFEALQIDTLVVRHPHAGAAALLARTLKASVINAGDGAHEHPTQALLDMFTVTEKKGPLKGLKVALVGDILHSRVARSNILGFTKMGARVTVCSAPTMLPRGIETMGVSVTYSLKEAIQDADVILLLRIQFERHSGFLFPSIREYKRLFALQESHLPWISKDALIMHPGPINRGIEIASSIADGPQSLILDQVTHGLAMRMACLDHVSQKVSS